MPILMSVKNVLLGLLAEKPRYGYELLTALDTLSVSPEDASINPGQIYSTLDRLERAGLIVRVNAAGEDANQRISYQTTEQGRQQLLDWLSEPVQAYAPRDEFTAKLLLALQLDGVDPNQVIRTQRGYLYQALHQVTRAREELDPNDMVRKLLHDKTIMHLEADLRWLDMAEVRLGQATSLPIPEGSMRPRGRPPRDASTRTEA